MITWIIGLSGSGKTSAGRLLYRDLKARNPATVFVDGDEIREIFAHDRGDAPYSVAGRRANAERIIAICAWLDRQGIDVVCCILSLFQEHRDANRTRFSDYFEVYLKASDATLAKRRPLYDDARAGRTKNVVGVDIPFYPPTRPDLVFDTDAEQPETIAGAILDALDARP